MSKVPKRGNNRIWGEVILLEGYEGEMCLVEQF